MTTIQDTIRNKSGNCLNIYFTAGYPHLDSTGKILRALDAEGVDLIELGLPYSDPLADGTTIQESSSIALKNGITLEKIFTQVKEVSPTIDAPIVAMGYYNQVLQYGVEDFLKSATDAGITGMIIPDLPMMIYERDYQQLFEQYGMSISFLISPQTDSDRIQQADRLSTAFVYVISQTSITGKTSDIKEEQVAYFHRIKNMNLSSPLLLGFGIHDRASFDSACAHFDGAIVGSAFIRALKDQKDITLAVKDFVTSFRQS